MVKPAAFPTDMNKLSIKPLDLGFDTEVAIEAAPAANIAAQKTAASQDAHGTLRQNLMLYPGE